MKKILSLLLMAVLGLSARAHAFDTAPYSQFINMPGAYGSTMLLQNHSTVGLGRYAGGNSWISVPFVTDVNLGYAQPVVITTNTSNGISVSGTTTVGDKTVIGFAVFPSPYTWTPGPSSGTYSGTAGSIVQVATQGVVAALIAANVTKGDLLITSSNALWLTETAAAAGTVFTQLSQTAVVAEALQTINLATAGGAGATSATCQVLILK